MSSLDPEAEVHTPPNQRPLRRRQATSMSPKASLYFWMEITPALEGLNLCRLDAGRIPCVSCPPPPFPWVLLRRIFSVHSRSCPELRDLLVVSCHSALHCSGHVGEGRLSDTLESCFLSSSSCQSRACICLSCEQHLPV